MKYKTLQFKLKYQLYQLKEFENFGKDLFNVGTSFKSRKLIDNLQEKMKSDISGIKSSPNSEVYLEPSRTFTMKLFAKVLKSLIRNWRII